MTKLINIFKNAKNTIEQMKMNIMLINKNKKLSQVRKYISKK